MKLSEIHLATTNDFIFNEEMTPPAHEKLAYLQMMIARQGKDPEQIMKRIRGLVDPTFAKREGKIKEFERWLKGAKQDEMRVGKAYGRKIKVTVLEATIREMLVEGFFSDISTAIVHKLRDLLGDEHKEHKLVTQALDKYPSLAGILRYAQKSEQPIYDDEKFWELVDTLTKGRGKEIKRIVYGTFPRIEEGISLFNQHEIMEARMSQVMADLGLDQDMIGNLMQQYDLRDEDYDLSRLREAYRKAAGKVEKAIEYLKELPGKAAEYAKELPTKAGKKVLDRRQVSSENAKLADEVVKVASVLMQVERQIEQSGATTPGEVKAAVEKAVEGPEKVPPEAERESIISTGELAATS